MSETLNPEALAEKLEAMAGDLADQFQCPRCGSAYFGSTLDPTTKHVVTRHCHAQGGCRWTGPPEESSPDPKGVADLRQAAAALRAQAGREFGFRKVEGGYICRIGNAALPEILTADEIDARIRALPNAQGERKPVAMGWAFMEGMDSDHQDCIAFYPDSYGEPDNHDGRFALVPIETPG